MESHKAQADSCCDIKNVLDKGCRARLLQLLCMVLAASETRDQGLIVDTNKSSPCPSSLLQPSSSKVAQSTDQQACHPTLEPTHPVPLSPVLFALLMTTPILGSCAAKATCCSKPDLVIHTVVTPSSLASTVSASSCHSTLLQTHSPRTHPVSAARPRRRRLHWHCCHCHQAVSTPQPLPWPWPPRLPPSGWLT